MKKKTTKPIKASPEYDSQRQTRVLLEQIRSEVKTVSEQHGSIMEKLEGHDKQFTNIESELNTVKSDLISVKSDLISVKSDLISVKSELTTVKVAVMDNSKQIKDLKTGQQELREKVERIENKLDTVVTDHEQRLQKLEMVK